MEKSVGDVEFDLSVKGGNTFKNQINDYANYAENSFKSAAKSIAKVAAGLFAIDKIIDFTDKAINAASDMQSAWTGLNSIVEGTGNSFSEAQKFLTEYTKDGLVSVEDAVKSYKNLLSRGYNTEQIENTMIALKDSASFGRQASYGLGEAVASATEGLKNENSILVDNAGVTKNVAKMWEEWARAHNTTTSAMTQAQKIEAEYNGILKETKFQSGDAAAYSKTFAGQLQIVRASVERLKVAFGKIAAPIAQLFLPAINAGITALTNFFNACQQVLSIFGISFPDVVSKSSSAISGVSLSASDASEDISSTGDAAVKAAKKINKAFGNVDEINVLNTKNDSGAGAGGSTVGGGSTPITTAFDSSNVETISSSVSGIAETILKYLEPLKNISFDNLIDAFAGLRKAVKPIIKTVGKTLEYIYFKILVPFAEWTIEDAIPAFLNVLAGALNFLSPIIEDFIDVGTWLWEHFLQPIVSWTGGVIVSVLNGLGDALSWIGQNEFVISIIEDFAIAIGLVEGALTLWNIAVGVWNSVGAIATVVTGAFGTAVAVLTSPITLVVAAIAVVIEVVRLLIQNWDDLKWGAEQCWNGIKSAFGKAFEWFNNTVVKPIVNVFTGTWNTLKNGAKGAWDGIKSVFSSVASFFGNIFGSAWQKVKDIFSTGGQIFMGIVDGIVEAFKNIVNAIIGGINKVVAIPFNTINGVLNFIKDIDLPIIGKPFYGFWKRDPIGVPEIPLLANGGYVEARNPQLAIIGDNTQEGEIVSPESKIYEQVIKAFKDSEHNSKQNIELTVKVLYEDGKSIIKKINKEQIDAGEVLLIS